MMMMKDDDYGFTYSVISVVAVAYTPASVHRSLRPAFYFGLAHTISCSWLAAIMIRVWVLWIQISTKN